MEEALSQLLTLGRGCFLQKQYAEAVHAMYADEHEYTADRDPTTTPPPARVM